LNQKFGKEYRLGKEASRVIEKGQRKRLENMVMYYLPRETPGLAIVAGRKVGPSYRRNRLKRWTREIFRKNRQHLNNYAIVIIYKPGAADSTFEEINNKLLNLWKETKLIK